MIRQLLEGTCSDVRRGGEGLRTQQTASHFGGGRAGLERSSGARAGSREESVPSPRGPCVSSGSCPGGFRYQRRALPEDARGAPALRVQRCLFSPQCGRERVSLIFNLHRLQFTGEGSDSPSVEWPGGKRVAYGLLCLCGWVFFLPPVQTSPARICGTTSAASSVAAPPLLQGPPGGHLTGALGPSLAELSHQCPSGGRAWAGPAPPSSSRALSRELGTDLA